MEKVGKGEALVIAKRRAQTIAVMVIMGIMMAEVFTVPLWKQWGLLGVYVCSTVILGTSLLLAWIIDAKF